MVRFSIISCIENQCRGIVLLKDAQASAKREDPVLSENESRVTCLFSRSTLTPVLQMPVKGLPAAERRAAVYFSARYAASGVARTTRPRSRRAICLLGGSC